MEDRFAILTTLDHNSYGVIQDAEPIFIHDHGFELSCTMFFSQFSPHTPLQQCFTFEHHIIADEFTLDMSRASVEQKIRSHFSFGFYGPPSGFSGSSVLRVYVHQEEIASIYPWTNNTGRHTVDLKKPFIISVRYVCDKEQRHRELIFSISNPDSKTGVSVKTVVSELKGLYFDYLKGAPLRRVITAANGFPICKKELLDWSYKQVSKEDAAAYFSI
jgi:hypothetical protein